MIKTREQISAAKFLPENKVIYVDANIHMYFVKGRIQDLYLGEAWVKKRSEKSPLPPQNVYSHHIVLFCK